MKRSTATIARCAALAALLACGGAHAGTPQVEVRPLAPGEPTLAPTPAQPRADETPFAMDPLMRALVIAIAANILREAAAQPDPAEALGNAIERRVASALADPNTMRMVEGALKHAFRDAPEELREPLALFAASVLRNLRRDMLQEHRRGPYY